MPFDHSLLRAWLCHIEGRLDFQRWLMLYIIWYWDFVYDKSNNRLKVKKVFFFLWWYSHSSILRKTYQKSETIKRKQTFFFYLRCPHLYYVRKNMKMMMFILWQERDHHHWRKFLLNLNLIKLKEEKIQFTLMPSSFLQIYFSYIIIIILHCRTLMRAFERFLLREPTFFRWKNNLMIWNFQEISNCKWKDSLIICY